MTEQVGEHLCPVCECDCAGRLLRAKAAEVQNVELLSALQRLMAAAPQHIRTTAGAELYDAQRYAEEVIDRAVQAGPRTRYQGRGFVTEEPPRSSMAGVYPSERDSAAGD